MPENDRQKRYCCLWKADDIVTIGTWVQLVITMVGWVMAGMEVVVGRFAGQSQGVGWLTARMEVVVGRYARQSQWGVMAGMKVVVGRYAGQSWGW